MGKNNYYKLKEMKSAILSLFLVATAAIQLNDAPPHFNEPTWNERMPSAAGLVQTSACQAANVPGVNCLFATGMNGDEDLGQDIIIIKTSSLVPKEDQLKPVAQRKLA